MSQQLQRVGALPTRVAVGEVLPDVAEPGGTEQRVGDRVGDRVGVAVTVEAALAGKAPTPDNVAAAARLVARDARPRRDNRFKVELAERAIVRAVTAAAANPNA